MTHGSSGTAVILTALGLEYSAVREHLEQGDGLKEREERGTLYEIGTFTGRQGTWTVAIAETGEGNASAGIQLERAVMAFSPQVVLFVGVAGGRKDVKLGDVVAADAVYDYEAGEDTRSRYLPRIKTAAPSYRLVQQARAVARRGRWLERIKPAPPQPPPAALVKPIAAGGKVLADDRSRTAQLLAQSCGDAVAVDMESHGFLHGAYANEGVSALVVRGVSDLLTGKDEDSDRQWQPIAARHAAAFAFELLADLEPAPHPRADPERPGISEVPGGESVKAGSAAHHGLSDIKTEANVHRAGAARTVILILLGVGVAAAFAIAALSTWPVLVKLGLGLPACVLAVLFVRLLREPEQRKWSRPAVIAVTVLGLYLAVIPLADLITSRSNLPGCRDVGIAISGERHAYYQLFRDAYDHAGGRQVLGCTRRDPWNGYVHPWGAGVSQDFVGRNGYPARLMLLPEYGRVVVMQDGLNRGYTLRYGPDTGPRIGYPIQDPQPCGKGRIMRLVDGEDAWSPGAMVTSPKPDEWIWLPRLFWERYRDLGGPYGRLGLPIEPVKGASVNEQVMRFERGALFLTKDTRTVKTDRELRGGRESPVRRLPDCLKAVG